jgi:Cys-rich four helix bundle protein (predicted Tat secretion target)
MNRREAILNGGAMALSASLGAIACGARNAVAQAPHVHPQTNTGLIDAAFDCLKKGQACVSHCIALLAAGDTSMAGCAASVHDMVAATTALGAIASGGGKHVADAARLAAAICRDCEVECRKHEAHHAVCKECADACARTVAACEKA